MKSRWLIGCFVLLASMRLWPALMGNTLVFGDNISLSVPVKLYTVHWLKQGIIPWWNPTIFAGVPWAEDISQSVFYPSTLLFMFFSPAAALNLTVWSHLIFTGWGMFLSARAFKLTNRQSVFAGSLWLLSPQVTYFINNLSTIQSIAWFPWVFYASFFVHVSWKHKIAFAFIVLGQLMAGYPQHVLYAILISVLFSFIERRKQLGYRQILAHWLTTALLVFGISAIAWLPFVQILHNSTRSLQTVSQAMVGSVNPAQLPKLLFPYIFDFPIGGFRWGPAHIGFPQALMYFSLIGFLALVLFLRHSKAWSLIFVFTTLFAFGSYLPGIEAIYTVFPFLSFARYPSMGLTTLVLVGCLFIAKFFSHTSVYTVANLAIKPIAVILMISIMVFIFQSYPTIFEKIWLGIDSLTNSQLSNSSFHTLEIDAIISRTVLIHVCLVLICFLVAVLALRQKRIVLAMCIVVLDVFVHTQGVLFFGDNSILNQLSPLAALPQNWEFRSLTVNNNEQFKDFGAYWEELSIRRPFSNSGVDAQELVTLTKLKSLIQSATPNWNMPLLIPVVNGYTTLLPKDFAAIWNITPEPKINFIDYIPFDSMLLREWSVGRLIIDKQFETSDTLESLPLIADFGSISVHEMPALPRIRAQDGSPFVVQNYSETPNNINFIVQNTNSADYLIIADRFDKQWRVNLNDRPTTILNQSGMRKVALISGENRLKLTYSPTLFLQGLSITLVSVLLALIILKKDHA